MGELELKRCIAFLVYNIYYIMYYTLLILLATNY